MQTIKQRQCLKGINQHKVSYRDPLRLSDVTGMLLFVALLAFMLWVIGVFA